MRLRELRKKRNITQLKLAMDLGLNQNAISRYETGEREADSYAFLVESDRGVDARKPIFSLCAQKNWPIIGMMPSGTDLESIFIRLVDRSNGEAKSDKPRRRAH